MLLMVIKILGKKKYCIILYHFEATGSGSSSVLRKNPGSGSGSGSA